MFTLSMFCILSVALALVPSSSSTNNDNNNNNNNNNHYYSYDDGEYDITSLPDAFRFISSENQKHYYDSPSSTMEMDALFQKLSPLSQEFLSKYQVFQNAMMKFVENNAYFLAFHTSSSLEDVISNPFYYRSLELDLQAFSQLLQTFILIETERHKDASTPFADMLLSDFFYLSSFSASQLYDLIPMFDHGTVNIASENDGNYWTKPQILAVWSYFMMNTFAFQEDLTDDSNVFPIQLGKIEFFGITREPTPFLLSSNSFSNTPECIACRSVKNIYTMLCDRSSLLLKQETIQEEEKERSSSSPLFVNFVGTNQTFPNSPCVSCSLLRSLFTLLCNSECYSVPVSSFSQFSPPPPPSDSPSLANTQCLTCTTLLHSITTVQCSLYDYCSVLYHLFNSTPSFLDASFSARYQCVPCYDSFTAYQLLCGDMKTQCSQFSFNGTSSSATPSPSPSSSASVSSTPSTSMSNSASASMSATSSISMSASATPSASTTASASASASASVSSTPSVTSTPSPSVSAIPSVTPSSSPPPNWYYGPWYNEFIDK
jgi:hypothetical protein